MFRTAELGQKVSKEDFDAVAQTLRTEMLEVQQSLRGADSPVIVVFAGVDGAGKSESVNLINEWMDPRWIVTRAYDAPTDEERERPDYWRYWRDLPPKGMIGLFLSCWYSRPILDHVEGATTPAEFDEHLDRVRAFEKMLADDGALIIKFWMHLGKDAQKKRLKALEKDPLEHWRVGKADWRNWRRYDQFVGAAERTIMRTGTGHAPWVIVEGVDPRFRSLKVLTTLRDAIGRHLVVRAAQRKVSLELRAAADRRRDDELKAVHETRAALEKAAQAEPKGKGGRARVAVAENGTPRQLTVLDALDLTLTAPEDYRREMMEGRAELNALYRKARQRGVSTLLVFEGWDAAGKGGAIRRLSSALDARDCRVIPVAAPTDEERAQHYLWRFWRHLPRAGRFTVFDRSWYGRVLVERVEGFAVEPEWRRAYGEINEFEEQLARYGMVVVKFWIHISKDEQYRRFKGREETAYKRWKLTDEDWRNRSKWDQYEMAVNEMVERCSTSNAPWTLVEGNDKNFARLKVLRTVCERLKRRLK
ncbi:MAG: polyphosphate kinase [Alphaproteobacteria bacterium]|nr:polyphosphate kinase [Alphaproteobacteria bacterium]